MSKEYDYLIVGAGLAGSVFAHEAKKRGYKCLVVDRRIYTGGNTACFDSSDGISIHLHGAHVFHTDKKDIWDYVNNLVEFNRYTNSPLACYDGRLYNLPFNMNTFYQLWGVQTPGDAKRKIGEQRGVYANIEPKNLEEQALKLCGRDVYEILIKGYTEKQWGRKATELPAFIINRIPFRFNFDNNYFNDRYQGIPVGGYNRLVNRLLDGIDFSLNVDYIKHRCELNELANNVFYSGCIDEYFDYQFGELAYRSLRFEHEWLNDIENFQGNAVVNYTNAEIPYTRIIEHKHFEFGNQSGTVITREYPDSYEKGKEPYYPINDDENNAKYEKYKHIAAKEKNVIFCGRLAEYKYYDMDDVIENVLELWR